MRSAISLPVSFGIAVVVTLAIFAFMQLLIHVKTDQSDSISIVATVELMSPEKTPPPTPKVETPAQTDASDSEPQMDALASTINLQIPEPEQNDVQSVDLAPLDAALENRTGISSTTLFSGAANDTLKAQLENAGKQDSDSKGYIEVVPYDTRQPNIPELAWRNKINGWVLVVFNVASNGKTKNVRVLDAHPRGVFEDEVLAAVSRWRYSSKALAKNEGDIVLTQKIHLRWKDYSGNIYD